MSPEDGVKIKLLKIQKVRFYYFNLICVKTHFNGTIGFNRPKCTWLTFHFMLYAFLQHFIKFLHHCVV